MHEGSPLKPNQYQETSSPASEVFSQHIEQFKNNGRRELLKLEEQSGLSREEIREARSRSGVLVRLDELFVKTEALAIKAKSFFSTQMGRKKEVFSPEDELIDIRKASREKRRELTTQFQEKLADLQENLTILQNRMIEVIRAHPNASTEAYLKIVQAFAAQKGLHERYVVTAMRIIEAYLEKHDAIEKIFNKFSEPPKLYKKIFGQEPDGKVDVVKGPMTLYFRCFNFMDFERAYIHSLTPAQKKGYERYQLTGTDAFLINDAGIEGLKGTVILGNLSGHLERRPDGKMQHVAMSAKVEKGVLDHEEQHAIHWLFVPYIRNAAHRESWTVFRALKESGSFETNSETRRLVKQYMQIERAFAEARALDEIFAFKKQGRSSEQILDHLIKSENDGGNYDFSRLPREKIEEVFSDFFAKSHPDGRPTVEEIQFVLDISREVFDEEYHKLIEEGLAAFDMLRQIGFSLEEVIGFLTKEPLAKWPKVAERYTKIKNRTKTSIAG